MTLDTAFAWGNQLAVLGWCCLVVGLVASGLRARHTGAARLAAGSLFLGGRVLPVLLGVAYAGAIWRWFGEADGGFGSLSAVQSLFQTRGMVFAGWFHYLAFDLWVGRWQVDRMAAALAGERQSVSAWAWRLAGVPCLLATFVLGPVGLLMFVGLLLLHRLGQRRR